MSKIRDKVKELADLGLIINNCNRVYECTSGKAEDYMGGYVGDYVLGSVPAWLEELSNIDVEITFNELEAYANDMSDEEYEELEKGVLANDIEEFKRVVENSSVSDRVKEYLIEDVELWEVSILNELEDMIEKIK